MHETKGIEMALKQMFFQPAAIISNEVALVLGLNSEQRADDETSLNEYWTCAKYMPALKKN